MLPRRYTSSSFIDEGTGVVAKPSYRAGKWHYRIRLLGYPSVCASFETREEGDDWERRTRRALREGTYRSPRPAGRTLIGEAVETYISGVLSSANADKERSRAKHLAKGLGAFSLLTLEPRHVVAYRNARLRYCIPEDAEPAEAAEVRAINKEQGRVGPQSVRHEMGLLSRAFHYMMSERGMHVPNGNPCAGVRRPAKPQSRERRCSDAELARLLAWSDSEELGAICRFAVATAMRRGEIARMRWEHVDLSGRTLVIGKTKNGEQRVIPLRQDALAVLRELRPASAGPVWSLDADSISQAFGRARDRAGIEDLHFHDLRHEAISRLFHLGLAREKVGKISGHRDQRSLDRYNHPRVCDLAAELDALDARARAGVQSWEV